VRSADWNSDDHACRLLLSDRPYRRSHGRTRGQPIVNEDDDPTAQIREWSALPILVLSTFQLRSFFACNGLDCLRRYTIGANHVFAEHAHASGRDRADRILAMSGHTEFADEEDVERSVQRFGDFECNRDASAGQREYDNIDPAGVSLQLRG
jgi:hypothetical protein